VIWVSWRQHRSEAIAAAALLGVLAVVLLVISGPMRAQFGQAGLSACTVTGSQGAGCHTAISAFMNKFGLTFNQLLVALLLVPGLIGVAVGAPLLGREFEHGTWRMAWSQTVPRTRWLVTKLALVTGGLTVTGAAMTAIFAWYRAPMDQLTGHFTYAAFDFEGLALTSYLICAFAFAVLAGLLMRRSIGPMVAAFTGWATVRVLIDFWLRPRYQTPLSLRLPPKANISFGPNVVPPVTGHFGDWVLSYGTAARYQWVTYQPASRFWHFQLIEAGLYLALAVAALATTVWLLHRRAA
jgi:hypothetical protein